MSGYEKRCLLCSSRRLYSWSDWEYAGVTSDARPWPLPALPVLCLDCGHVQQGMDDGQWERAVAEIYAGYQVHFSSVGAKQLLFSPSGEAVPRDIASIQRLMDALPATATGRLLDFGCGNGAYLKEFNALLPAWELHGLDRVSHFAAAVLDVPDCSVICPPEFT